MNLENTYSFSIVIPTYNRAAIIGKTIASALAQSYANLEVIVVDDGGTDNTEEVVSSIKDERLSYYKKDNAERAAARNFGAQKAKGEYVYFLDSDDILYPHHLETAVEYLKANPVSIFFQQYEFTLENGKKKSPYIPKRTPINEELVQKGNFISCHGMFIQRELFLKHQFNEDRQLSGSEDYELWLRLAARYPIYYSPEVTATLIYHDDRSVLNFKAEPLIERKERMLKYLFEDAEVAKKFSKYKNSLYADAYSYVSLHLALAGYKKEAMTYLRKSIVRKPSFIFQKRFWAILKHSSF